MNRFDWLAGFFRPPLRFRSKRKRDKRKPKQPRCWIILGRRYYAHTKSEARALAKEELGYPVRLPAGTVVIEEKKKAG